MDREQETPAPGTNRDEFGKRLVEVLGELFDASARNPHGKELAMLFIAEFGKLGDTFRELRPYIGRIGPKVIGTLIRLLDVWIEPVEPTVNVAISTGMRMNARNIFPLGNMILFIRQQRKLRKIFP